MKQILQSLKTGETEVVDVPMPGVGRGRLLIDTSVTLVSAGTERMLVEFGKGNWLSKARQQPDKVKMVLQKVRSDGLAATLEAVRSKLDQPITLGYCNVGTVLKYGADVRGFAVGDRVVSNGQHAEMVSVPANLTVRIPDAVSDEQAVFTVLGAIGLQGIRLVQPTLGECVVVTGLGLIGLLTVQMLVAQGCRVLGIDTNPERLALARQFGAETVHAAEDVLSAASAFSRGRGVDAVLLTAATKSSDPVSQAAQMCRKRGRIVLVGVTGLNLSRADFYEKELSFQVSCSYGPGRYDPAYEEQGQDYPIGFVRWTEQRNFEAVLDLMAAGKIDVAPLITHRFAIDDAGDAYSLLASSEPSLGILLDYPEPAEPGAGTARTLQLSQAQPGGRGSLTVLGAGNYASRTLIPAFIKAGAIPHALASANGSSAAFFARKFGFALASSDTAAMIADPQSDTVVIGTRHDSHARLTLDALRAGKHVFCEKPLCLTLDELAEIEEEAGQRPGQLVMVGYNRRFAPQVVRMKALLDGVREPKAFVMTVNAGAIPAEHWTQDPLVGGGRIIGEACHFIDLIRHLAGSEIVEIHATSFGMNPAVTIRDDKVAITLRLADGSIGTIHYLANGNPGFPKERLEVFAAKRILQLDNFRKLRGWGWSGFRKMNLRRQDKGAEACVAAFVEAVRDGKGSPIAFAEIVETTRYAILAAEMAR
ncbi:bi-domain-containing oxidoreductase [Sphingomonas sp. NPDC092331]|jgi:predicted dehydrogenase|uniref:bi-domain-containing oxidoreductase n=1 Tax=unclassified Sphingomonas TaxID=196159 RepID=UPI0029EBE69E|nr:bi-domain-containing oxidoreductase [Pseudomonadota bacterium]